MLVVFDLDGTLHQTEVINLQAVHRALVDFKLPLVADSVICRLLDQPGDQFIKLLLPDCTPALQAQVRRRIGEYEFRSIPEQAQLYSGVREMVSDLHSQGIELGICSYGGQSYVEAVLRGCGIRHLFTYIYGRRGDSIKSLLLTELLEEAGQPPAVMVGDSPQDLRAALGNNLPFIGAVYGYGSLQDEYDGPLAGNIKQLQGLIQQQLICLRVEQLCAVRLGAGPCVVGINGIDTAGKTEFTLQLAAFLRRRGREVTVIHLDDFHNSAQVRRQGNDPLEAYYANAFDITLLEKKLLRPLQAGGRVHRKLQLLDLENDTRSLSRAYDITPQSIVLLEGTLLFREPLDDYFNLRLFLKISLDEMLRRANLRDVPRFGTVILEKYHSKYIPLQRRYLAEWQPEARSDLLIDNEDYFCPRLLRDGRELK